MEIENVLALWKDKSKIDSTNLLGEIIKTPSLHAEFLEYYLLYKKKHVSSEMRYNKLAYVKRKYYRGEMTKVELEERSWPQYQGLKPSGGELTSLLAMDNDMVELEAVVTTYKNNVSIMEYIMKQIGQRDYSLKTAVDVQRFMAGN